MEQGGQFVGALRDTGVFGWIDAVYMALFERERYQPVNELQTILSLLIEQLNRLAFLHFPSFAVRYISHFRPNLLRIFIKVLFRETFSTFVKQPTYHFVNLSTFAICSKSGYFH